MADICRFINNRGGGNYGISRLVRYGSRRMSKYDCMTCKYRELCESHPHNPCFVELDEMEDEEDE